jgi:hypothetical protein
MAPPAISLFPINLMNVSHSLGSALTLMSVLLFVGCAHPGTEADRGPETAPEGLTVLNETTRAPRGQRVSFDRQIKPILESKCLACHSGSSAPWNYSLESRALAFAPGAAGPRIIPGEPDRSILVAFASTHKNVAAMPIVGNRLTETESRILRRWIAKGAYWPEGRAGMLTPAGDALRPESARLREEWRAWFENNP